MTAEEKEHDNNPVNEEDEDEEASASEDSDENSDEDDESSESDNDDEDDEGYTVVDYKELGNGSYKQKDYREAIAYYSKAIALAEHQMEKFEKQKTPPTPENPLPALQKTLAAIYSNRAAAHQMLLMYDNALEDCNAAIQCDPTFLKVHWRKAKVLTTLGRLEEAIKAYSMGLVHDPNDTTALKEKEEVKKIQQRFELSKELLAKESGDTKRNARQALAQMDIVLCVCPNWNEAQLVQLEAKVKVGGSQNVDQAYALSTKLLRKSSQADGDKNNAHLLLLRAQCLFYQGAMDDAMKHLKQILAGDPDNKPAFQLVKLIRKLKKSKDDADQAYKTQQFDKAIPLYTEALEATPIENESFRSKLYFNRAACHNALRQHSECVADCTSALKINPDYTKARLRRAASNLLLGGKDECQQAINDYEAALKQATTETEERDLQKKIRAAKIQLKRAGRKDLYKILGVNRDATENEIKKAYRKLALKLHPDRQTNSSEKEKEAAEAKFREVNLAHEILSDPAKKQRYDQGVDEQDIDDPNARPGGHHGHGGFGGMDQDMLFEMFMRQQMGGGRRGGGGGGGFPGGFHF